ncbi:MAG: hypothetical protein WBM86_23085 [Waterburya sp.]
MPKGRPGGNPDIAKYGFKPKHDWDEPCNERMQIRMPSSMKAAIKAGVIKDWQEVARKAIAAALEEARGENPQPNRQTP